MAIATPPLPVGTNIDIYRIEEKIGQGGMGVVYRAHDPRLERPVALKLLKSRRDDDLLNEARVMARLNHPNLVTVFDIGWCDHGAFMTMELIEGIRIDRWVEQHEPSVEEVIDVFIAAGKGIVAAHEAGVVHRDLKPSNIMLDDRGHVRVMDFGLADVVASMMSMMPNERLSPPGGTPAYMAPEQHTGSSSGPSGDQFSFCVALWEVLFHELPFDGHDERQLYEAKSFIGPLPPPRSRVGRRIISVLRRGMHPEPHRRFASMKDLLRHLEAGARSRSSSPRPTTAVLLGALCLPGMLGSTFATDDGTELVARAEQERNPCRVRSRERTPLPRAIDRCGESGYPSSERRASGVKPMLGLPTSLGSHQSTAVGGRLGHRGGRAPGPRWPPASDRLPVGDRRPSRPREQRWP